MNAQRSLSFENRPGPKCGKSRDGNWLGNMLLRDTGYDSNTPPVIFLFTTSTTSCLPTNKQSMTALLHLLVRQINESDPILVPVPIPIPVPVPAHETNGVRHGKPVIAFIIGLSIITLASVLNAAGLNLTKLDHVRVAPY